jgi:RluA family pseudouridine synthase
VSETIIVPLDRAGLELDEFLCLQFPGCPKGIMRRVIRDGRVLVDGTIAQPSQRLRPEQVLLVDLDDLNLPDEPTGPAVELPVLHEEPDWLAVDKPPGIAVEPERWERARSTVAGALLRVARERSGSAPGGAVDQRLRPVHRLDKETSGVLVVAKELAAERFLRGAFEQRALHKTYLALVEGEHPLADGAWDEIDLAIGSDPRKSGRMVVDERGGKPALTRVAVEQRFHGYTLLCCEPRSGRTHQIRVHLAAVGFPLAVDRIYGRRDALHLSQLKPRYKQKRGRPERPLIDRLTLHCAGIDVPRPRDPGGPPVPVRAPLPRDMVQVLKQLAKVRPWTE